MKTQAQTHAVQKNIFPGLSFLHTDIIIIVSFVSDQAEITVHPKNKTRIEGVDVTFSCNATGNPKPTISWSRSGSPVHTSNNSRFSFSEGKKELTITNVNRTDSGKYQCVASNSLGNDTSDAATLNVQCKYGLTLLFLINRNRTV